MGGTLLAAIPANPDHLDAALSATTEGWEILEATNDGLMAFRRAGGGAGSQVVPDLATAMPKISDGGLVYTFHMRSGVRFSPPVDRAVRPSDLKWSIERILKTNSPNVGWYTGIAGATAYEKGKAASVDRDRRERLGDDHQLPPDATGRDIPRVPGRADRLRVPRRHARQGHLHRLAVPGGHGPVHDLVVHPEPGGRADAEPELPPLAEHARRASRRDQDRDRRHGRAGGERDRRRPARLVLREPAAGPSGAARAAVPQADPEGRHRRDRVLLDERASLLRSTSWPCARRSTTRRAGGPCSSWRAARGTSPRT